MKVVFDRPACIVVTKMVGQLVDNQSSKSRVFFSTKKGIFLKALAQAGKNTQH
jgi:hypothetical protein